MDSDRCGLSAFFDALACCDFAKVSLDGFRVEGVDVVCLCGSKAFESGCVEYFQGIVVCPLGDVVMERDSRARRWSVSVPGARYGRGVGVSLCRRVDDCDWCCGGCDAVVIGGMGARHRKGVRHCAPTCAKRV
jgi:hypothetical protein